GGGVGQPRLIVRGSERPVELHRGRVGGVPRTGPVVPADQRGEVGCRGGGHRPGPSQGACPRGSCRISEGFRQPGGALTATTDPTAGKPAAAPAGCRKRAPAALVPGLPFALAAWTLQGRFPWTRS